MYPSEHIIDSDLRDYSMVKGVYTRNKQGREHDSESWTSHWATAIHQDGKRAMYDYSLLYLADKDPYNTPYPTSLNLAATMTFAVETLIPKIGTACMNNYAVEILNQASTSLLMPFPARRRDRTIARPWHSDFRYDNMSKEITSPVPYFAWEIDTSVAIRQHFQDKGYIPPQDAADVPLLSSVPAVAVVPMELPADRYTELGLVVLVHRGNTTIFDALSCAVNSRWILGSSIIESGKFTNRENHDFRGGGRARSVITTEPTETSESSGRNIRISPSWYEILSPTMPDGAGYGVLPFSQQPDATSRSLMERLLENVFYPLFNPPIATDDLNAVRMTEGIVSTFFADGLSRCGSFLQLNVSAAVGYYDGHFDSQVNDSTARSLVYRGSPKKQQLFNTKLRNGYNATEMVMTAVFTGYVLAAKDSFDFLAIFVVSLHAALAICFTAWVFFSDRKIMELGIQCQSWWRWPKTLHHPTMTS